MGKGEIPKLKGNIMNRVLIAFVAVLGCCGLLKADATYAWKADQYPTSILDGKVTFTYEDDGGVMCIKTMNVTAAEGETITFTGDKMQFVPSSTATIKQLNSGKVVFQNEVAARTFDVSVDPTARTKRNRAWKGYSTFVGTEWTTVFENANLDDAVLTKVTQCETDPETGKNIPNWSNRGLTLTPCHVKRSPGFVACQYQGNWGASSAYVVCIWAEFRQSGDDIQMRIVDAGWVQPLDPENIFIGVDPDALCGRYTWNHHEIRTTGNANSGCGMDAVSILSMNVVYRFENKVTFGGSPSPNEGVRMEFADASKVGNTLYAVAGTDSEIVFRDGSKNASDWHSNAGAGTLIFETTKLPASASETNCIEITGEWKKTGAFRIRGIEGAPMILRAKNQKSYPTGEVIVESNGILDMNGAGENASLGVKNGACAITVNKGGVLRQSANSTFGTNQVLTVNGGTVEFGVGDPNTADFGTALAQVTLRDGARLVNRSSSASRSLRIGRVVHDKCWVIGGVSPSTNEVPVQFMGAGNYVILTNTFNVAQTGDGTYDADFVTTQVFDEYSGSDPYKTNVLRKIGLGTFRFDAAYKVPGWVELEQGLIRLGKSNLWGTNKNRPVLNLRGGGLSFVSGTSNTMGEIRLYENASLVVENGATVKFPDLSGVAWTSGKTLNITMPRSGQEFLATVQFGSDATALTAQQLSQIRVNGRKVLIDDSGRLVPGGMMLIVR